ncbi:nucleotidyl transferase AbiEii/AbiGii toxin family protein [Bradyrhizobium sp. LB5.2]
MPRRFEPKLSILPAAQREVWPLLAPALRLRLVLYGGTAVALQLGHRESLDFDFFCSAPLDKGDVRAQFGFLNGAAILQDAPNTMVILADMPSGSVKISFFRTYRIWSRQRPDADGRRHDTRGVVGRLAGDQAQGHARSC